MRKKTKILICLVLLLSKSLHSQKSFFNYEKIKIDKSWLIEKEHGGIEFFPTTKHAFLNSSVDYEEPKNFKRTKSNDFEPTKVEYYYSKNDSIVKFTNYNWSVEAIQNKSKFFKTYNAQFDKIVESISKDIGVPTFNQAKVEKVKEDIFKGCYERKSEWENDKCKVVTRLVWSENKIFIALNTSIHYK